MECKYCGHLCKAVPGGVQCDFCDPPKPTPREETLADLRSQLAKVTAERDAAREAYDLYSCRVEKENDLLREGVKLAAEWMDTEEIYSADIKGAFRSREAFRAWLEARGER